MKKTVTLCLVFLLLGIVIGVKMNSLSKTDQVANHLNIPVKQCQYTLINPTFCSYEQDTKVVNQASLTRALTEYLAIMKQQNSIGRTSVFYRDLQNGPTVNIDAFEEYYAGSLLKVPIMMLYLKYAESNTAVLDKTITIGADIPKSQLKDSSQTAERGKTYTVRELIEKMIIYSDNSAKYALERNIQKILSPYARVESVLIEAGVQEDANDTGLLTLQEYAALFRMLYNAQYLSPEMSQLALDILSKSDFDRGIIAGVPKGTIVANKFGIPEATRVAIPQLHDCGIVYHPSDPYLLCIFAEGKDYPELEKTITTISDHVYKAVAAAQ